MENDNATPVNHGLLSSTGTVATSSIGGGISAGAKTALYTIAGFAAFGFLVSFGPVASLLSLGGGGGVFGTVAYTLGFGALGVGASFITTPLAAAFGFGKGAVDGSRRVAQEKGAAKAVDAQMQFIQAQSQMQGMAPVNDNRYNFPAQGTRLNQAGTTVNAMQADGRVAGQQLQLA